MKCRCGHTAEHHAQQGRNPALSFCVESACPCEEYRPPRRAPKGAVLLSAFALLGCSPTSPPDVTPTCVIERCWPDSYACTQQQGDVFRCDSASTMTWSAPDRLGSCNGNPVACTTGSLCLVNGNALGTCQ